MRIAEDAQSGDTDLQRHRGTRNEAVTLIGEPRREGAHRAALADDAECQVAPLNGGLRQGRARQRRAHADNHVTSCQMRLHRTALMFWSDIGAATASINA